MAQDPEEIEGQDDSTVDPSHELDMVSLFSSQGVDAEMEADMMKGVLESNGIPSFVMRATGVPAFGFELLVPRASFDEAQRLIAEAQAAGPEAAAEAEAASEEPRA
jgi:hypothetical protein